MMIDFIKKMNETKDTPNLVETDNINNTVSDTTEFKLLLVFIRDINEEGLSLDGAGKNQNNMDGVLSNVQLT